MLTFNENTVYEVRKLYNLHEPGRMEDAVQLLKDWAAKQEHFVKKDINETFLEKMIINCKGSLERAKEKLDKICTYKTLMPQFFGDYNAKEDFKYFSQGLSTVTLPKMMPTHERVTVCKFVLKKVTKEMISEIYRCGLMHEEYAFAHDYCSGYHLILDFSEANILDFVTNVNIMELRQYAIILLEGYTVRAAGIHVIIDSNLVDALIGIIKRVVTPKVAGRITVHKNVESLYKIIPREILPKDLGGEEKSTAEMNEEWLDILSSEEFRNYWREMIKACTDESKRQSHTFNDQYMGTPGSFRALIVD